jgi:predicted RNA-binding Zn-ribbon protein involved in translation (DUF1610 family)
MMAARNTRRDAGRPRPQRAPSARGANKATSSKRPRQDGDVDALVDSIGAIARRLGDLQTQARALGIFTNDRDLLTCPKCGLIEDVLVDGRLVTYHEECNSEDTGLRFAESAPESGRFTCPECGSKVDALAAEPDEARR